MADNQFVVDLGSLKLSAEQHTRINAAIQGAVAGELANINLKNQVILIPIDKWPRGPITDGIIARPLDKNLANILKL